MSRLLRLGVSGGDGASGEASAMKELEMELALLREENARLKVERHRPADAGRVIERMRHLGGELGGEQRQDEPSLQSIDRASHTEHTMQEIREGLIAACREVQQAMQGIRGRLGTLSVDLQDGARERPRGIPTPVAEGLEVDLAEGAHVSPSLAQSAAA